MKVIRWAAVAVTALFVLLNVGAALDKEQDDWIQAVGAALAVVGLVAVVGLAQNRPWGRIAVIGVGALNVAAGVAALVADEPGGGIGIVVGGLGVVLGLLAHQSEPTPAHA